MLCEHRDEHRFDTEAIALHAGRTALEWNAIKSEFERNGVEDGAIWKLRDGAFFALVDHAFDVATADEAAGCGERDFSRRARFFKRDAADADARTSHLHVRGVRRAIDGGAHRTCDFLAIDDV